MAALTADRDAKREEGAMQAYQMAASTTIYKGSLVALNTSGYAVPGADTVSFLFAGVAFEKVANTGSAGDKKVRVHKEGDFEFNFSGTATQADVGKEVTIADDQTVALAATTTNDVVCGRISEFISATKVRVRINRAVC